MTDYAHGGYELIALLGLGFRAMVDELHRRLAALGFDDVRPAHGFAFVRLAPDGATGNELAEHLGVSKQAASQIVDYLARHDYVTRRPDPRDGRGKIVVLTARGWACIQEVERILADIEGRLVDEVGPARMEVLRADLRRLVAIPGGDGAAQNLRPVW